MNSTPAVSPVPRGLEVESLADFDGLLAEGARTMRGWRLQSLDLRGRSGVLRAVNPEGAVFLGCRLRDGDEQSLRHRGALVFPLLPGLPFDPYRPALYSGVELYAGVESAEYEETPDARIYAWVNVQGRGGVDSALSVALHDHAVGEALQDLLTTDFVGRRVIGVMGGHAALRGSDGYAEAARLGRELAAAGGVVATGGGPGAMEAANLGAYLSAEGPAALDNALVDLAAVPSFRPSVTEWARVALQILAKYPEGGDSLGIPTWFYGHEPPNLFATRIAKYFANAVREAVLLEKCTGGIVFLPGAAGTVQEIFQDACENYYGTPETITPMVLVGRDHWTEKLPAWPLLQALAAERGMAGAIHLVDDVREAVELLS